MNIHAVYDAHISRLRLRNFRNIEAIDWQPKTGFNVLVGDNGEGKTNLLEAIYYSLYLRSFRSALVDDLIRAQSQDAALSLSVASSPFSHDINIWLHRMGAREVKLDGKRPRSSAKIREILSIVLFHPADLAMVASAELRRGFLDNVILSVDPTYETVLSTYQRALRSRNRVLKLAQHRSASQRAAIEAYDEILSETGSIIGQSRYDLVENMKGAIIGLVKRVLGEVFSVEIKYECAVEPSTEALRKALQINLEKDLARGFTTRGPHVDDLQITVRERNARHQTSQGQQRSIVLALKMAELSFVREHQNRTPVLILDDISSELDRVRNELLFEILNEAVGQVFITTTHPEYIRLKGDRHDWFVKSGGVSRVEV